MRTSYPDSRSNRNEANRLGSAETLVQSTDDPVFRTDTSTEGSLSSGDTLKPWVRVLRVDRVGNDVLGTQRVFVRILIGKISSEDSLDTIIRTPEIPQSGQDHDGTPTMEWARNVLSLVREANGRGARALALGTHELDWEKIRRTMFWFGAKMAPQLGNGTSYATYDLLEGSERKVRS